MAAETAAAREKPQGTSNQQPSNINHSLLRYTYD
jgi:hypothetical protein